MHHRPHRSRQLGAVLATLLPFAVAPAQQPTPPAAEPPAYTDLSNLSLEELLDVEVSLVSRHAQRLLDAPASVFVLTRRDIERSGLSSIPELLRLVPGMQVERINASRWAISARGFAGQFANKLLVLMDGRSAYTPLFSGTWWDMQDLVLDDIERIEVIRGPGGTNWGANAVNGVVNVVTRKAGDTHGNYLQTRIGNEERVITSLRHGGELEPGVDYRIGAKYRDTESTHDAADRSAGDEAQSGLLDFRLDGANGSGRQWTLSGGMLQIDEFGGERTPAFSPPYYSDALAHTHGITGHLLARAEWTGEDGAVTTLQGYYDGIDRQEGTLFRERRHTVDVDLQHRFAGGGDHQLTAGIGYRLTVDSADPGPLITAVDEHAQKHLFSAFARDEYWLCRDLLQLDLGLKYEHNDFTGHELQPEIRLSWLPGESSLVWASASHAVRTPSRAEDAGRLDFNASAGPGGVPVLAQILPDSNLEAENLWAYELGARSQLRQDLIADVALFVHDYDDLIGYVPGTPTPAAPPPHLVLPLQTDNAYAVRNYGAEVSVTWQASETVRLVGGYAFLEQDLRSMKPGALPPTGYADHPRHQGLLRGSWDFAEHWQADAQAFAVDRLENGMVPAYVRLDLRLCWSPDNQTRLCLGVQNLLDDRHPEAAFDFGTVPTEPERAFYLQFEHRF